MKTNLKIADKDSNRALKALKGHYFVQKIKKISTAANNLRKDLRVAAKKFRLAIRGKTKR